MTYYAPEAVTNMALVFDKIDGLSLEEKNIAAHALLQAYRSHDNIVDCFRKGGLDDMYVSSSTWTGRNDRQQVQKSSKTHEKHSIRCSQWCIFCFFFLFFSCLYNQFHIRFLYWNTLLEWQHYFSTLLEQNLHEGIILMKCKLRCMPHHILEWQMGRILRYLLSLLLIKLPRHTWPHFCSAARIAQSFHLRKNVHLCFKSTISLITFQFLVCNF